MIIRVLLLSTLVFVACAANADIYKCKDAKGAVTFVDTPCPVDQNLVDYKVTNDPNTLNRQSSRSREKTGAQTTRSGGSTASSGKAATSTATAASGESAGCDSQRKRLARLQTQTCIEGLQIATGRVMCMPDAERREYLSRLKTTIEAVCS